MFVGAGRAIVAANLVSSKHAVAIRHVAINHSEYCLQRHTEINLRRRLLERHSGKMYASAAGSWSKVTPFY